MWKFGQNGGGWCRNNFESDFVFDKALKDQILDLKTVFSKFRPRRKFYFSSLTPFFHH